MKSITTLLVAVVALGGVMDAALRSAYYQDRMAELTESGSESEPAAVAAEAPTAADAAVEAKPENPPT